MEKQSNPESEDEEDGKKYGDSIVTNLTYLSKGNNQITNYLNTLDLSQKKKEAIRGNIKARLQSIRRSKENGLMFSDQNKYKNFYNKDLKEYLLTRKLRELNKGLSYKEHHLIKKLGIKNDYDFPAKNETIQSPRLMERSTPTKSLNKTGISFAKSIGKSNCKEKQYQQLQDKILPTIILKNKCLDDIKKQQKKSDEFALQIQTGMPNSKKGIHKSFA